MYEPVYNLNSPADPATGRKGITEVPAKYGRFNQLIPGPSWEEAARGEKSVQEIEEEKWAAEEEEREAWLSQLDQGVRAEQEEAITHIIPLPLGTSLPVGTPLPPQSTPALPSTKKRKRLAAAAVAKQLETRPWRPQGFEHVP